MNYTSHTEPHFSDRNNWLRAGILGANDGLISTASLMMGIAATNPHTSTLLLTGTAALIGGAISMAAGEYVSVSGQSDTEKADLHKEHNELKNHPERELQELIEIYRRRGLNQQLAQQVAQALTRHNALEAHARDEIGITETMQAKPFQAAAASATAFCIGAILPLAISIISSPSTVIPALAISTVTGLALLGYSAAKLGGAPTIPAIIRTTLWGIFALTCTGLIGYFFDTAN